MAQQQIKIHKILPVDIANIVADFCESMVIIHTREIISIAVYGSAISTNYIPKVSNINILCIFNDLKFAGLKSSIGLIKSVRKKKIIAPLLLTLDYIKSSLDTFPIEFLEIIEHHRTVYGKEVLSGLKVPLENLRLQCEQQLKGYLLRLRQTYLENGTRRRVLIYIMRQTFSNAFPLFRNMLRLVGESIPETYEDMIIKLTNIFQFDGQVFLDLLRDKKGLDKVMWKQIDMIYSEYMYQLEMLSERVDKLKAEGQI